MKVTYDPSVDMMMIELNDNYPFNTDSDTIPGLAIMYDQQGKICAIEIEDASRLVTTPNRMEFECFTELPEAESAPEATVEQADAQP